MTASPTSRRWQSRSASGWGKDTTGDAVMTDLTRMPHSLIAGTTGSGKSGCINTILTSILLRATPDDVRMILVDPKRIELGYYESIPHLLTPVVSSPKQAAAALTNVVGEMERRYERMSLFRARSLPELNRALRSRGDAASRMTESSTTCREIIIRSASTSRTSSRYGSGVSPRERRARFISGRLRAREERHALVAALHLADAHS